MCFHLKHLLNMLLNRDNSSFLAKAPYSFFRTPNLLNITLCRRLFISPAGRNFSATIPQDKNFELKRTLGRRDSRFYFFKIVTELHKFLRSKVNVRGTEKLGAENHKFYIFKHIIHVYT